MRLLFILGTFLALRASAQYTVTGVEDYPMPEHLVITNASSDLLNARGRFITELERNGFHVITEQQREQLWRSEQVAVRTAEVLHAAGPDGVSENELKDRLQARGVNWSLYGQRQVARYLAEGQVRTWVVETQRAQYFTKKTDHYAWVAEADVPAVTLDAPNTFHFFSFNYTYRESLTCSNTFSEIHGSINDISGGANLPLIQFEFKQPLLGAACPSTIVPELARRMKPDPSAQPQPADIDVQLKAGPEGLAGIGTLMIVPQQGTDCQGVQSSDALDLFALELIQHFDIVDRSVQSLIFEEQQLALTGLIREADLVEAGMHAGAQGILTVQGSCLAGRAIWKAKLISVETSVLLLSAIGQDATPQAVAEAVGAAL
jgi:hypothetical protein